ncbi:hypothetical protein MP638_004244, partial [Amoeboaphelidium occidentale]
QCNFQSQNVLLQVDSGLPPCYLTNLGITQILSEDIAASKSFNVINLGEGLSMPYTSPEAFKKIKSKRYSLVNLKHYDSFSFAYVLFE